MVSGTKDFRPFWINQLKSPLVLGTSLILILGIPRFILVLYANETGDYRWIPLIFITMWIVPWIFLTKSGRLNMGIKAPVKWIWLIYAIIIGGFGCFVMFKVALYFYGDTISNWFVYISDSYKGLPTDLSSKDRLIYFTIYALISMVFSPIGEELFYRGVVHHCFSTWRDHRIASIIDSAAFSITHLAHFGIVFNQGHWKFLAIPGLIWMLLLFLVCLVFSYVKQKSGSILGAIIAHAGFNLTMVYFIFYHIL